MTVGAGPMVGPAESPPSLAWLRARFDEQLSMFLDRQRTASGLALTVVDRRH